MDNASENRYWCHTQPERKRIYIGQFGAGEHKREFNCNFIASAEIKL